MWPTPQIVVAFFLLILNCSIKNIKAGSIIETADVIPANNKAMKNATEITFPSVPSIVQK